MYKNSCTNPIDWVASQVKQLNTLVKILYTKSTPEISSTEYEELRKCLRTAESDILKLLQRSDISTTEDNCIFTPYSISDYKDFEEYFNASLNPDNSPVGFLEELDRLIAISRDRKVIITTLGKHSNNAPTKILEDYLSSIPPF